MSSSKQQQVESGSPVSAPSAGSSEGTRRQRYGRHEAQLVGAERVGVTYGAGPEAVPVFSDISLDVARGEILSIVGPSGVGKTTLLKVLAGLFSPTEGLVWFEGTRIDSPPLDLAVVFQNYADSLFPWMKVSSNVELPLAARRVPRSVRRDAARQYLASVGLGAVGNAYPGQLSGGMQQRVAIARALASGPKLLLMDEPFGSLDAQTRIELEDMLLSLREGYGFTAVLVTHDVDEAIYLGDRVLVLSGSPASVVDMIGVPFGRDRDQIRTKAEPDFGSLRGRIMRHLTSSRSDDEGDADQRAVE